MLSFNNVTIKFRTNNVLGNYNRRFKEMIGMDADMSALLYINNIIENKKGHIVIIGESKDK